MIPCKCSDPDYCSCIVESLPATSGLRKRLEAEAVERRIAAGLPAEEVVKKEEEKKTPTGRKRKSTVKGWSECATAVANELVVYMPGAVDKKTDGGGRKNKQTNPAAWVGVAKQAAKVFRLAKSLCGRLGGKFGRFRGTLSARRSQFTERAVLAPDIGLSIDEVGLPYAAQRILTFPDTITNYNRASRLDDIRQGLAAYMFHGEGETSMYNLRFRNRTTLMPPNGTVLEMFLKNGQYGIINRQPTLHKPSFLGTQVVFLPTCTLHLLELVQKNCHINFELYVCVYAMSIF